MKTDACLATWMSRASSMRTTRDGIARSADRLRHQPGLAALRDALPAAEGEGAQAVLDLAEAFMADDRAVRACLDPLIESAARDPFSSPPLRPSGGPRHKGLVLLQVPSLTVQIAIVETEGLRRRPGSIRAEGSIVFSGQHNLFRFVEAGRALLSFWEAFGCADDVSIPRGGRCRVSGSRRIGDGEVIRLDGRYDSFSIDSAESDLVYLQATTSVGSAPFSAEYNAATGAFVAASSNDEASSRQRMMLALLREMDRRDAAPLFVGLATSGPWYTRWEAMRELIALDAELAMPHLRRMAAEEPQPELRQVAAQSLHAICEPAGEEVEPCLV